MAKIMPPKKDLNNAPSKDFPYVDLGLSVMWAKHNLGSCSPSDLGNYYSWGETKNKLWGEFERDKYKFGYDVPFSKYHPIEKVLVRKYLFRPNEYKTIGDGLSILEPCDDAAHKKLKGKWRIPTADEFQELLDSCTIKRAREAGEMGYRFSSKIDGFKGNSVFLPNNYIDCYEDVDRDYFGGYWSSILDDENPDCALCMSLSYQSRPDIFTHSRFSWGLIRPVMDKNQQ